jgi:hypothetical protein
LSSPAATFVSRVVTGDVAAAIEAAFRTRCAAEAAEASGGAGKNTVSNR